MTSAQLGLALATAGVMVRQGLPAQQVAHRVGGHLDTVGDVGGEGGEIAVELVGEGEQLRTVIVEELTQGYKAVGAPRGAEPQKGDDEIIPSATLGMARSGEGEHFLAEPAGQAPWVRATSSAQAIAWASRGRSTAGDWRSCWANFRFAHPLRRHRG